MSQPSSARERVLARVRQAAETMTEPTIPRDYRQAGDNGGSMVGEDLVEVFIDRLVDYRAEVHRAVGGVADGVDGNEVVTAVSAVLNQEEARTVVVADGYPEGWTPNTAGLVVDGLNGDGSDALSTTELDETDAVLTTCAVAIAETGTIVLDGSADQGRRAITLVPDLHVCVVRADQIVETVPEGVALLDPRRPQTWISGPSATSDIELDRVEGVHGPRVLEVVLLHA